MPAASPSPSASRRPRPDSRTSGSAAAFIGIIGLPEPGYGPRLGAGGLRSFCRTFNARFDQMADTTRPEWRSYARAEREARVAG